MEQEKRIEISCAPWISPARGRMPSVRGWALALLRPLPRSRGGMGRG